MVARAFSISAVAGSPRSSRSEWPIASELDQPRVRAALGFQKVTRSWRSVTTMESPAFWRMSAWSRSRRSAAWWLKQMAAMWTATSMRSMWRGDGRPGFRM